MICPDCRDKRPEENVIYPIDGEVVSEEASHKPRKPKRKKWKLILMLMGVVLVLAVAVILIKVVMFLNGPAMTVARGLYNVLEAESFTLRLSGICDGDQDEFDLEMMVNLDPEDRKLTALCHYSKNGEEPETIIIYHGYLIREQRRFASRDDGTGYWVSEGYDRTDISHELDDFFEMYEKLREGGIQWEELLGPYYDRVQKLVDFDELEDCLTAYVRVLNDAEWLEAHANFEKKEERGVARYSLKPDIHKFVMDSAEYFKDGFREESDYHAVVIAVKSLFITELKNLEAEMVFGIEDDLLVSFEIEGKDIKGDPYEFEMQLSHIGDTEMDEAYLEEILQKS